MCYFYKVLDEGREVRAIFCDISQPFDRVWYKGLLFKLRAAGISGSLLNWFSDYFNDRKQKVVLPGARSSLTAVGAGLPLTMDQNQITVVESHKHLGVTFSIN